MANVGQIVYNVENPFVDGGMSSTENANIYSELVQGEKWERVSIQAPPGTYFILNGIEILVGRTGIYESPPDILISSLKFIQPTNIALDTDATKAALDKGITDLYNAESERATALSKTTEATKDVGALLVASGGESAVAVNEEYEYDEETGSKYWEAYSAALATYVEKYREAIFHYNNGVKGIYEAGEELDLLNVIIDYVVYSAAPEEATE